MTARKRSMMANLPLNATGLAGVVLLGLAAWWRWRDNGWGAAVWLAATVATLAIRMPHSLRNSRNVVVTARKDTAETALLTAMFLAVMILPLLRLGLGLFAFADYALPDAVTAIGALAQIPYLWLFWRAHADLGRNWSPGLEVRENHALVTNGVYARIRHPMYAAIWISALAQPLLVHNWIGGLLAAPAFLAMWLLRVPVEEAMMRQKFGAAYDDYCRRAGRLFPKPRRLNRAGQG